MRNSSTIDDGFNGSGRPHLDGGLTFFRDGGGAGDSPALLSDRTNFRILDANAAALALFGCERGELAGRVLAELLEPRRIEDGTARKVGVCFRFERETGESVFYGVAATGLEYQRRHVVLHIFHDVGDWVDVKTDLTNRNLELSYLATHDHLTNIFNRLMFRDTLELANARLGRIDRHLGVLYIDLDGFKQVNEKLGHDAGDRVLMEVAGRLREAIRTSDVPARLGGDEFGVILENLRIPDDALKVARHILDAIAQPFILEEGVVRISASIGAVVTGRSVADVDKLVARADRMMFTARSNGSGQVALATVACSRQGG